jgi:prenylcysteine oxidase/farnesylcysteine lyase
MKSDRIVDFLSSYAKSYASSFPSFSSISAYSASLGYTALQTITLQKYLDNNGVNQLWTREFETGSTRFNYGQDADAMQAVAGMASLSADSSYAVKTGNYKIFEQFLSRSGATVKLNTAVRTPSSNISSHLNKLVGHQNRESWLQIRSHR